ncbi:MAG: coenzyme F420-0:L-glutamate ligase [Chloroflexota bacterium]
MRQTILDRIGQSVGVVITDSHGRPFRLGTVGVAIGVAGIPALWDRRGEPDRYGFQLQHTDVGVADEIAAAAGLLMGQAAKGQPVVLCAACICRRPKRTTDLVRPKDRTFTGNSYEVRRLRGRTWIH